jgi:hypothetical protein
MCTSDYAAPIPDPNHFRVSNKLFLIWDIEQHKAADFLTNEDYCFNHVAGLPPKNGSQSQPINMNHSLEIQIIQTNL